MHPRDRREVWWGFLDDAPHHPATSPDEVEFYAVRMLALDTPVSLETHLSALKANGRTEELLALLGKYERLRLARTVPDEIREKLRQGEWHLSESSGRRALRPIRYDSQRVMFPGKATFTNPMQGSRRRCGFRPLRSWLRPATRATSCSSIRIRPSS